MIGRTRTAHRLSSRVRARHRWKRRGVVARSRQSAIRPANAARPESGARTVSWWLLLAALFLVPLATSNFTWIGPNATPLTSDQFDVVKAATLQLCLLGSLAAWLVAGVQSREFTSRWAQPLIALSAFLGWSVLATIASPHPPTALFGDYARPEGLIGFLRLRARPLPWTQSRRWPWSGEGRSANSRGIIRTRVALRYGAVLQG